MFLDNQADNKRVVVPNNKVWGEVITNVFAEKNRRVDMVFGISYSDDIDRAKALIEDVLAENDLVLDDPESVVQLHELGASSVDFTVRPWTRSENYWDVYWALNRAVKLRFDAEGVSIPFPQRDIHMIPPG